MADQRFALCRPLSFFFLDILRHDLIQVFAAEKYAAQANKQYLIAANNHVVRSANAYIYVVPRQPMRSTDTRIAGHGRQTKRSGSSPFPRRV